MKIFRKLAACSLSLTFLIAPLGFFQPTEAAAPGQGDIPQIHITTKEKITKEAYVPAEITILDAAGGGYGTISDLSARIKVRGNSTAMLAKQPFNIKLSASQSVLGMPAGKKWSLLANYLDYTYMRNKLSYGFAEAIGLAYSSQTRYADVYLNGKYNGNYLVCVPVEVGEKRVDIDLDKGDWLLELSVGRVDEGVSYLNTYVHRFEINEPEMPTQEQLDWLFDYLVKAENAMKSGDYQEIVRYIDVDSFVDFFIIQEYFKNIDSNTSSTRYYIKDNKLYAGPLWDMDLTAGNVAPVANYGHYLTYNNWEDSGNGSGKSYEGLWAVNPIMQGKEATTGLSWIGYLMDCPPFADRFYARFLELQEQIVNLYQANILGPARVDLLLQEYQGAFERDLQLWPIGPYRMELHRTSETTFQNAVAFLRDFLKKRNDWLLAHMIPADFTPSPLPPVYREAQPTNAVVLVDGRPLTFDAYNIEDNNYFKLRDLAMAVSGSGKQFDVAWNESARVIDLLSGRSYTPVGGELAKGQPGRIQASLWTSAIYKDGQAARATAYNIWGNNYFKLRDVAQLFDIGILWNGNTKTIEIQTDLSYSP